MKANVFDADWSRVCASLIQVACNESLKRWQCDGSQASCMQLQRSMTPAALYDTLHWTVSDSLLCLHWQRRTAPRHSCCCCSGTPVLTSRRSRHSLITFLSTNVGYDNSTVIAVRRRTDKH